jgi:hypothetical protein
MRLLQIALIVGLGVLTAGCTVAAGIFKAGFWVGIIVAVVLVVGLVAMFRGRG